MVQGVAQPSAQFSVGPRARPDGSWPGEVRLPSGEWKTIRIPKAAAQTHRAAAKWMAENAEALAEGRTPRSLVAVPMPVVPTRVTFSSLSAAILEARDADVATKKLSAATKGEFKTHWALHIEPFFGKMAPHEVETRHLLAFRDKLARTKEPRTTRNIFKSVSILFKIVLGRGLDPKLARHPLPHALTQGFSLPAADDGPIVALAREEAARLMLAPGILPERRARYALAFLSGMRDGELAGLLWADVDFEATTISVTKAFAKTGGLGKLKTKASERTIPLHPQAAPFLQAWKSDGWMKLVGHKPRPMDPIFPNEHGQHHRPRSPEHLRDDLELVAARRT